MHVRYPIGLRRALAPGAGAFAVLFSFESIARASIATLIPLQAYAILGDERDVTLLFVAVGATGLIGSFVIPDLIRLIKRRWVYTLGHGLLLGAALLLATESLGGQISGQLARVLGVACLNITLSLYIMDYIRKRDLTRSEPLRLLFSASAWTLAPTLGVWLAETQGAGYAYLLSAGGALAALANFWWLRIQDKPVVAAATRPVPRPWKSVGRFIAQPRLRLAWLIAFGRSSFWAMFFLYAPLLMVAGGYSATWGAVVVSGGNAMLFITPLIGRLADRIGIRRVVIGSYFGLAASTLGAALAISSPPVAAGFLLLGSFFAAALDAVGTIPFLRSVHPYERPQMTTVFRTYIDFSELLPTAIFALLLTFFELDAVFIAAALGLFAIGLTARYLPRSM